MVMAERNINFYQDDKGTVIEEHGRPEPMDYIVDEKLAYFPD